MTANFAKKNQGIFRSGSRNQRDMPNSRLNNNTGPNNNNGGNLDPIICQICFLPGHGANKCKSRFNPAFVPQRNYGRGGRGNFRPNFSSSRGFVARPYFPGYSKGFNGQYNLRGYGYQGNMVYPDQIPIANPNFFPQGAGSSSYNPTAFNCYSGPFDNTAKLFIPSTPIPPSAKTVEDPLWYIDSGDSAHVTNNSGIT